jgi:SAM-dependent methyltransferase
LYGEKLEHAARGALALISYPGSQNSSVGMLSEAQFIQAGIELSREANVQDGFHGYFMQHRTRIYKCLQHFGLLERKLGDVLEIGPFYSYTPFILQPQASSYTVLEGDDSAAYPLKPLYAARKIHLKFVDLFEIFGPTHTATHALPFADRSFDTFMCWGTMEHFNFNPVKFVRELFRVLKPGGTVYINVPNRASFQNLFCFLFGHMERDHVDTYFKFEDYSSNGKKAFYGFHWREYSGPELGHLFQRAGFVIQSCRLFTTFQDQSSLSTPRKLLRHGASLLTLALPRFGTDVYLVATRQA